MKFYNINHSYIYYYYYYYYYYYLFSFYSILLLFFFFTLYPNLKAKLPYNSHSFAD